MVTAVDGLGYQYAFVGKSGELLFNFWEGDPTEGFAPLETKVTGIYNPKIPDPVPPHDYPDENRPVMASLDVDGFHGSTVVEYNAIPPWNRGFGFECVLPYPAVGKAAAVAEDNGWLAGYEWHVYVWVFDENASVCGVPWEAAQARGIDAPAMPTTYIGVDESLNVLVLLDFGLFYGAPGPQKARWFTIDGKPLTDEFDAPIGHATCSHVCMPGQAALVPLIGGGLAYQEGQQWLGYFPTATAHVEPPPSWLTDWNYHTLHQVGGQGYAFIPYMDADPRYPKCEDRLEFVSAYGEQCGTMMLDGVWPCGSGWRMSVGRDGSVIQRGPLPTIDHPRDCDFAIWDRLLQ